MAETGLTVEKLRKAREVLEAEAQHPFIWPCVYSTPTDQEILEAMGFLDEGESPVCAACAPSPYAVIATDKRWCCVECGRQVAILRESS